MQMSAQTLVRTLEARRGRERLYRLSWGAARWLSLTLGLLAACCLIDWAIDRTRETPLALRVLMSAGQVVVAVVAALRFVVRLRVPSLDDFAARAEGLVPGVGHRLVTALQLNRAGAKSQGMSPQLIADVTREAEAIAGRGDFPPLADARRAKWAAGLLTPVLLALTVTTALAPRLVGTLVARQALLPIDIARPVRLTDATAGLWPSGDAVTVRILVDGPFPEGATGELRVYPEGQPAETFTLKLADVPDGETGGVLTAELPPASTPLTYRAWFQGSRLREPGRVRFEPRPVVKEVEAALVLPRYVDPTGKREYVRYQPQGEVFALADSAVMVKAAFSKPVASATVVLYARDAQGKEVVARREPLAVAEGGEAGGARFELPARPSGYRVECVDANGFGNLNPPRRGVTLAEDRPPEVRLLPEVLKDPKEEGPIDDFLVDGMPLRLGGQVQVGYFARSPIGLARAAIVYRVNDGPWSALPLAVTTAEESRVGKFLPELGVFRESGPFGQVEFYPAPAADPEQEPDGLTGGGRYNFKTSALKKRAKDAGRDADLEVGDTVEIRVVVYDRHPAPAQPATSPPRQSGSSEGATAPEPTDPRRPGGWSPESRIKQVVSDAKFEAWRQEHYRARVRLSELEQKQRAVFQAAPKN